MSRRRFHRQRLCLVFARQGEPAVYGHKWEDEYKKCRCEQQRLTCNTRDHHFCEWLWAMLFFFFLHFFSCGKFIALPIWCDACPWARSSITYSWNLVFCLFSIRFRLIWEGLSVVGSLASLYLQLFLDKMYDAQQDHLGLEREIGFNRRKPIKR